MSKEIILGSDARERIKKGIDKACDAVRPTLGAVGMSAIIDWEGLDPIVSDDGVTILKNLEFKDKYENMGLKMLRKGAVRTSVEGGDGTATTTVLTQAIINEAFKEIEKDSSKIQEVRERLERGLEEVLSKLSKLKHEVKEEDIENIATISSLDPEVAKLIADVIKEIGIHGVVTVEKGHKIGYTKEIVKGARFDKGLISPNFITNPEREECVLENPFILLVDRKVSMNEHITSVMNSVAKAGSNSILIIADDVDGLAFASLSINHRQGTFNVACVRNPYTASRAKDFLTDMALLTGGTVISEESGFKLDTATVEQCGQAEKVVVTKDTCTIIGGNSSEALETRIKSIETQIDETTSEYTKSMLKERLASLKGGIGVIRVGAYTDTDFNAKKYKFENAINSTQAALQEGILPGGGVALVSVSRVIDEPIFKTALMRPFLQQVTNAGITGESMALAQGLGINFKTKEEVNMFDAGIIDPFKVTRLALESAVSIATTLISVECAIANEPEKDVK